MGRCQGLQSPLECPDGVATAGIFDDLTGLFQSGQLTGMSGTFTNEQMFDFLIVKAGTNAVLWYTGGVTEFDWSLVGFTQNEASHIVIYGGNFTAVPEPATWAMMLMGFGAAGYAMRRRRSKQLITQLA